MEKAMVVRRMAGPAGLAVLAAVGAALIGGAAILAASGGDARAPGGAEPPAMCLPEGSGLAARYPGDYGIGSDPRVLFADDFETGTIEAIGRRWGEMRGEGGQVLAFSRDVPPVSGGSRSLQMTASRGENTGGHLYTRLPRGVDTAFARFYV